MSLYLGVPAHGLLLFRCSPLKVLFAIGNYAAKTADFLTIYHDRPTTFSVVSLSVTSNVDANSIAY